MLKANKSIWFERFFARYNRNLLKRRFHTLQVSDLHFLRNKSSEISLIIYANHSSWWDGLVIFELLRGLDFENYVMMEEKHLRKLFLFRKLGAFSVVRENPRQALKSINYAANLLTEKPNRMLLIFPQGEILPNDARPLKFYSGLARIVEKVKKIVAIPIALRYEFLGNFKPEIYLKIGEPDGFNTVTDFDLKITTANFEKRLTETLEQLKRDIVSNQKGEYIKLF